MAVVRGRLDGSARAAATTRGATAITRGGDAARNPAHHSHASWDMSCIAARGATRVFGPGSAGGAGGRTDDGRSAGNRTGWNAEAPPSERATQRAVASVMMLLLSVFASCYVVSVWVARCLSVVVAVTHSWRVTTKLASQLSK